ncbi:MAG: hypothetical protein KDJ62_08665 [Rhodobiaceae bacterium]|nr:hypothetical protein [Rhodobiaceae bacterium]MCC0050173.1 hypothetical protein [Rhodobiaceae bacterium]
MTLAARILLFVIIVVVAAAAGTVGIFFGSYYFGILLGASTMEGGLAMGAAGLAPWGGAIGGALGAWYAWRLVRRIGKRAAMAGGYGITLFAALCVGGWFLAEDLTDGDPYEIGEAPTVLVEWRLPETVCHECVDRIFRFTARSTYKDWTLSDNWDAPRARDEDGHTILRFRVYPQWRQPGRIFQLWRAPNHDDRITVDLDLGYDPQPSDGYGSWRDVPDVPGNAFRTRVIKPG